MLERSTELKGCIIFVKLSSLNPSVFLFLFLVLLFLGRQLPNMEVPRLGRGLIGAVATSLHHSSWQHQILNPLSGGLIHLQPHARFLVGFISAAPKWELLQNLSVLLILNIKKKKKKPNPDYFFPFRIAAKAAPSPHTVVHCNTLLFQNSFSCRLC